MSGILFAIGLVFVYVGYMFFYWSTSRKINGDMVAPRQTPPMGLEEESIDHARLSHFASQIGRWGASTDGEKNRRHSTFTGLKHGNGNTGRS